MNATRATIYLPLGLPRPQPEADGLSSSFWEGLRDERILVQRCSQCGTWQWPAEWICHACHGDRLEWTEVPGVGAVHSWTRSWHPMHPAIKNRGPFYIGVVELAGAPVRMVGNLLFDGGPAPIIGDRVVAVFERHRNEQHPFTLLQWEPNNPMRKP